VGLTKPFFVVGTRLDLSVDERSLYNQEGGYMAIININVRLESKKIAPLPSDTKINTGDTVVWTVIDANGYELAITFPSGWTVASDVIETAGSDSHEVSRTIQDLRRSTTTGSDVFKDSYTVSLKLSAACITSDDLPITETCYLAIERNVEPPGGGGSNCNPKYPPYLPAAQLNVSYPGAAESPDPSEGEQRPGR
jgi:hypothetical protein